MRTRSHSHRGETEKLVQIVSPSSKRIRKPSSSPKKRQKAVTESIGKDSLLNEAFDDVLAPSLHDARILMVGAGGIGCELLKNLVLLQPAHITLIDLDTIDVSNLNRQFLFRRLHVGKSKSQVARESALEMGASPVDMQALCANIKDTQQFPVTFFKSFDLVMNALDNIDARNHVNGMCMAANVPLIESGTAGYLGQVQVIRKDVTECFECQPKEPPRTFPVCTIRSTPSAPIHCIVWAKSYLFPQLFGVPEPDEVDSQTANVDDDEAKQREAQKSETEAFTALLADREDDTFAERVFQKVFADDVRRLLGMTDLWKTRAAPSPLDLSSLLAEPEQEDKETGALKDQRCWTVAENARRFIDSVKRLTRRYLTVSPSGASLSFDKDDNDALDFVTACSNLRANVYGIPMQSRFQVKAMAGNIIPAIATTNAIIAGLMCIQALQILANQADRCLTTYLTYGGRRSRVFQASKCDLPRPDCVACRYTRISVTCNTEIWTLRDLLTLIIQGDSASEPGIYQSSSFSGLGVEDVTIVEGARLLYDADFDDNIGKTLSQLGLNGKLVKLVDEDVPGKTFILSLLHADAKREEYQVDLGAIVTRAIPVEKSNDEQLVTVDDDDMIIVS